jgi:hypothetical protein
MNDGIAGGYSQPWRRNVSIKAQAGWSFLAISDHLQHDHPTPSRADIPRKSFVHYLLSVNPRLPDL